MSKKITEQDFYLDKPAMLGIRGWSLLIPSVLAAIGFCAFAVLAFSFTELQSLPPTFRRGIVIIGSFALAIGGELGTLSATIEIFRKRKNAEAWDWLALAISAMATMAAFILSFAALLGVNATWSEVVKLYGPVVLGVLAAFDAYAGFAEVGMYLSTYDDRMTEWQQAFDTFRRETLAAIAAPHPTDVSSAGNLAADDAPQIDTLTLANTARQAQADNALDRLLSFYADNPRATQTEAARQVSRSRQWVSGKLAELEAKGAIKRNGDGVEVLAM